jgi:Co/Zn/Cd efflux system component
VGHKLGHLLTPHSHDSADKVDQAMESSREGVRVLWISLAVLGATAVLQMIVVVFSGSVALLGDALHNEHVLRDTYAIAHTTLQVDHIRDAIPAIERRDGGDAHCEEPHGAVHRPAS